MQVSHRRSLGLLRSFILAGAAATLAVTVALAWLISGFLERQLLQRDGLTSADMLQSVIDTQGVAPWFQGEAGVPAAEVLEFLAHLSALPDVLRINVYRLDKQVLWSSRREMIGRRFGPNEELDEALRGDVVVHRDTDGPDAQLKSEHLLMNARPDEFIENYLPVRTADGRSVIGVIELYRRPVALVAALDGGRRLVALSAAGGGLFIFLCLVWFVRRADAALRLQQHKLVESETLVRIGELSGAVAHSIRNPLGSIRSSAELHRELGDAPEALTTELIQHVDRIETLVRTLLGYAQQRGARLTGADLGRVLREVTPRIEAAARSQGKPFLLTLPPGPHPVEADPELLAQLLDSLLSNALEATAAGQAIRLDLQAQARAYVVAVEDEGPGVPAAQLGAIFEPFFTTKPRGLGMGLALARRAAERLGGRLHAEAVPGRGLRMVLSLPRSPVDASARSA